MWQFLKEDHTIVYFWWIKWHSCYCWNRFFKYLNSSLLAVLQSDEEAPGSERARGTEASSYCKTSCNWMSRVFCIINNRANVPLSELTVTSFPFTFTFRTLTADSNVWIFFLLYWCIKINFICLDPLLNKF